MKLFWENSPLYQREQELYSEFRKAKEAMDAAGEWALASIRIDSDSPHGDYWWGVRQAYKDAVERYDEAYAAWKAAEKAFDASPAGQARDRWRKDPLAVPPPEQEAA